MAYKFRITNKEISEFFYVKEIFYVSEFFLIKKFQSFQITKSMLPISLSTTVEFIT